MPYIGTSPSNGVRRVFDYTATAGQTSFSGSDNNSQTLSYADSNFIDVFQNGVLLVSSDYTATTGTTVVLDTGATVSDSIQITVFDVFSVADTVSKADGGTFDGNVTMGGTLSVTSKTGVGTSSPAAAFHVQTTTDGTGLSGDDIYVARFHNQEATSDRSFGVDIQAGSSTTDQALRIKDHDGTNTLMIVDGVGHVTKPKQPAFCVTGLDGNQDNVSVGGVVTVKYYDERFDQNSDYNNSNYTFTAPVTGKYYLHAQVYVNGVDSAASYYSLRVDTSNHDYVSIYNITHTDTNFLTFQIDVIADMDASDTATVGFLQPDGTAQTDIADNTEYTFFCGHLVC